MDAPGTGQGGPTEVTAASAVDTSVGQSLRELRQARRLTLQTVASQAAISESFLSQIERGKASPSLQVLFRVANVFGLTPRELLRDQVDDSPVHTPKVSRRSLHTQDYRKQRVIPHWVSSVEVLAGSLEPQTSAGPQYTHGESDELLLVLSGTVHAEVGPESFTLREGDSLYYRTSMPHTLHNPSDEAAEVLWIIAPPG